MWCGAAVQGEVPTAGVGKDEHTLSNIYYTHILYVKHGTYGLA